MQFRWTGRVDSQTLDPKHNRIHQVIQPWRKQGSQGKTLLGFAVDDGVKHNQGRVGAKSAPDSIRQAMASYAWPFDTPLLDAGNIEMVTDLAQAQQTLAHQVADIVQSGQQLVVLGGGHETAYGHFCGLQKACPQKTIGIINIDAHFDLRTQAQASSGTPFKQIADDLAKKDQPFHYFCLGVSECSNTQVLFDEAKKLGVWYITDFELAEFPFDNILLQLERFISQLDYVYFTIDLDALSAHDFFAVSAPSGIGVSLEKLIQIVSYLMATGKVISSDLVEYNPSLDRDQICARTAASLAWHILTKNEFQAG